MVCMRNNNRSVKSNSFKFTGAGLVIAPAFTRLMFVSLLFGLVSSCAHKQMHYPGNISTTGKWILEQDNSNMLDPQTSGLTYDNGYLYTVSDGSAHESQIQRLHKLDAATGEIIERLGPIVLSPEVQQSCFASYLSQRPDYEAVVALPKQENAWLLVTEDATRSGTYTDKCKQTFAKTGSTEHPTLLVKVELLNGELRLTGLRPLQFSATDQVGDAPNDGIEGMTLTKDGRILFGLEKDAANKARVFEVAYSDDMFTDINRFLPVQDSQLWLPDMGEGNHPINAMDVYYPNDGDKGFLILGARNDHQLWIADLDKKHATVIIDMVFNSPCSNDNPQPYKIANTALEGLAVKGDTLFIINDPWKKVYPANTVEAICSEDKAKYDSMSPLLFQISLPACLRNGSC